MDQNWNGGNVPQNQNGGYGQAGPAMPSVPNAGANMMNPQMPGVMPVNPMAVPAPANEKKGSIAETIILVFVCLIAAAAIVAAVIFYMNWQEIKTDTDTQIEAAKIEASKAQKDIDEKAWVEREKTPNMVFTGPSDYGSLSFNYPKTWSVYIDSDGSNNSDFVA